MDLNDSLDLSELWKNESNTTVPTFLDCFYRAPAWVHERFYLVAVFGTTVAVISVFTNVLLFINFVGQRKYCNTNALYLAFLALCDIFISISYILLMSINVLMDYLRSLLLFRAWFFYMVPMITISHIFMTTSSFLLVAASFEQYLSTVKSALYFKVSRNRAKMGALALLLGVLTKGTLGFEYAIQYQEHCAGTLTEYVLYLSNLAQQHQYALYWRFWFRNVVTVFLPFALLSYFNWKIVRSLRAQHVALDRAVALHSRNQVRAATRMLAWVVTTYLVSNLLNVVVTVWEHVDKDSLFSQFRDFYSFSVDVVSLLTVLACAVRLPIYCSCKESVRRDITQMLCGKRKAANAGHCSLKSTQELDTLLSTPQRRHEPTMTIFEPQSNGTHTTTYIPEFYTSEQCV